MVQSFRHRRGTTLDLSGEINVTDAGNPVLDMTDWQGECKIKTLHGALVAQAEFTWLDASQRLCRVRVQETDTWEVGTVETDILLTSPSGDKVATERVSFEVTYGVS